MVALVVGITVGPTLRAPQPSAVEAAGVEEPRVVALLGEGEPPEIAGPLVRGFVRPVHDAEVEPPHCPGHSLDDDVEEPGGHVAGEVLLDHAFAETPGDAVRSFTALPGQIPFTEPEVQLPRLLGSTRRLGQGRRGIGEDHQGGQEQYLAHVRLRVASGRRRA